MDLVAKQQSKKSAKNNHYLVISIVFLILACLIGFALFKGNLLKKPQPVTQTYVGTLPCADCSGLLTTLTIIKSMENATSGTYVLNEVYEGKTTKPFVTEGTWEISVGTPNNASANVLTLSSNGGNTNYLMKGDKQLELLDQKKQTIDSPFDATLTLQDTVSSQKKSRQLANPASVNCAKQGGTLKIQTLGNGAQYGLCQFENNQACEEWALYRGDCPVGGVKTTGFDNIEQQYCAWVGGQTLAVPNAVCNLPSGNVCKNDALYNGTCDVN